MESCGFLLRFARLHGPAAMKRVFAYLKNYKAQHGAVPQTPEEKNDLLVKALAFGANANILCEIDSWRWAASQTARTNIAQQYRAQNYFCVDSDADGYSPVMGDYNNYNGKIHPGAVEVRNGFDDDCNDVIDDVLTAEPVTGDFPNPQNVVYPGRITGRITSNDGDTFTFNTTRPMKVAFKLCSAPDFQGWLFLHKGDGSSHGYQFVYRGAGECSTQTYDLDEAGVWSFDVALNGSSLPGAYSVQLYDYQQWPAPWGATSTPTLQQGSYRLTATAQTLANAFKLPTHVSFWVDGFGFVGTVAYAPTTSFDWTPPPGLAPGTYGYRAQLFSGSIPVEAWTAAQLFQVGSAPAAPALTSLTLSPTTVAGGNAVTGKVTLSAPAPASGTVIALADTNPAATVPSSVTVPAGATSKTFTVSTSVVTAIQSGTVTAKLGAASKSVTLKVRPIGVKSLTLTPNPVVGPNAVTGTVVLEHAAAPGSINVTLTSTNPSVANPTVGTITIPAGVTSKTFTVRTTDVSTSSTATIKATANAVSKSRTLTVN
jgi:hypothetical protein